MLRLTQIRDIAASALLHERLFHGSLFNAPGEVMRHDLANLYWDAAKIKAQATNLVWLFCGCYPRANFTRHLHYYGCIG